MLISRATACGQRSGGAVFDGPALLEAIGEGEASQHRLPEELLDPRGPGGRDLDINH